MRKLCMLLCIFIVFSLASCEVSTERELILPEAVNDEIFTVLDETEKASENAPEPETESTPEVSEANTAPSPKALPEDIKPAPETEKTEKTTDSTPEPTAVPEPKAQPETASKPEEASTATEKTVPTCTLEVRCDKALASPSLSDEKRAYLPSDGIILAKCEVSFTDGESVFDILLREMQARKIHFEFTKTPAYNSAYIEGISNLYEFDCGNLSGWNYAVNGTLPRVGCSQYKVKDGDSIVWMYICDYTAE